MIEPIKVKTVEIVINASLDIRIDSGEENFRDSDAFRERISEIKRHIKLNDDLYNVEIDDIS